MATAAVAMVIAAQANSATAAAASQGGAPARSRFKAYIRESAAVSVLLLCPSGVAAEERRTFNGFRAATADGVHQELLRRRDARLMAFVRQQLMLPEDTSAGVAASAPSAEQLRLHKKYALTSPNVVLLTEKQRRTLFQSSNKAGSGTRLEQEPEQDPGQQRQEQGACCGEKTSRGCGEAANLSIALIEEELQQQEERGNKGTPLLLSARSPGAAAAAAAAAVLMLPAHPPFPCSSSSTPPLPLELHQQLGEHQQEDGWSAETAPVAAAAAESSLVPTQVVSVAATPRSCTDSFPPVPVTAVVGPSRQAAAVSAPATVAAARTGQRLEAVKQCANRVREALRLESKISALITHTERSSTRKNYSRRSSCSSRSSSSEKLFDGLKETFATPRPATPRNGTLEVPSQMQRSNKNSSKTNLKVVTPSHVSTGSGEWVFPPMQQQLHQIQEPQQQRQEQQQALHRYGDDCSCSNITYFDSNGQGTSGFRTRSLQCTPRAATDSSSSRSSRGAQLITSGANGLVAAANPAPIASATAETFAAAGAAAGAAAENISNKQQDRVVVRLSLGSFAGSSLSKSPRAASAEAQDPVRQEELQRKQLQKQPAPQQQTEARRRNSIAQSLKARADAYRGQQQQQQQDGVPLTPKGSIFRTAISQGSGSPTLSSFVSNNSSSRAAIGAVHLPQKVLAKLPPEVDNQKGGNNRVERRVEPTSELFASDCMNQDEEGDEREIELLLASEEAQCSFDNWGVSPMQ
ncbi:LOW QUALITY PROTEIN: uncharacterized protein EMH_0022640 [Eimeria mitis]|uniref:Uncharacterized protein n=1 Tax=Eimeria mitis TaxID=44415 RepID=U6KF87_9EIME|nr:LOW QUALITY PROTEIN: uncharacterized protein EMH_0022640 [Eimeria mitis]CDJ34887.1 hypothetical protein, conserved [Eimeria mitis]